MSESQTVKVAVDAPLFQPLTYNANIACLRGHSVVVPLGKRKVSGVVLSNPSAEKSETKTSASKTEFKLKDIFELDQSRPVLPEHFIQWLEWMSDYYVHPVGTIAALSYPPLANKESKRKSKRAPVIKIQAADTAPNLTEQQKHAISSIEKSSEFSVHLLHGSTGSGKTEVYLHLLKKTLESGRRGLVLVPEIALTPQLINRFSARFGESVAVLHSQLTDRERTTQWWSMISGEKKILIGARSALFCPVDDWGLIIVDEEHEPSYKQEEKLKYHGRDSAVMLAKLLNIPIVLGSATPSLESWANAKSGKYHLHSMPARVEGRALPTVSIIDMREKKKAEAESKSGLPFWLSPQLYEALQITYDKKEQAALFLNRRGIAQSVFCNDCGFVYKCPNCEISLTLHGATHLVCHYCDYSAKKDSNCPSCKDGEPIGLGLGTEQIEADIQKLFPEARLARADRDEVSTREDLEDIISKVENREIDFLIGTQMIAKGLDFPGLTTVGIVLADIGFNIPDFRSTERSFQLLTQVSGRAGRHTMDGGKVFIQTYNTEHPSLHFSKSADYVGFATQELTARTELTYPPYGRLCALRIQASTLSEAENLAEAAAFRAQNLIQKFPRYEKIQILGPAPAPLLKIRNKFRYHLLFKAPITQILSPFCRHFLGDEKWVPSGTKVQVDIDPINLL